MINLILAIFTMAHSQLQSKEIARNFQGGRAVLSSELGILNSKNNSISSYIYLQAIEDATGPVMMLRLYEEGAFELFKNSPETQSKLSQICLAGLINWSQAIEAKESQTRSEKVNSNSFEAFDFHQKNAAGIELLKSILEGVGFEGVENFTPQNIANLLNEKNPQVKSEPNEIVFNGYIYYLIKSKNDGFPSTEMSGPVALRIQPLLETVNPNYPKTIVQSNPGITMSCEFAKGARPHLQ